MNMQKKKGIAIICIAAICILAGCKTDSGKYDPDYDFAVIETTGAKNQSIVTYYDQNFDRINQQKIPYGGMTASFSPAIVSDGVLYASPEGLDDGKGSRLSISMDLETGKISEYQHDQKYTGERNFIVDRKRIFVNTNLDGNSFLSYYDTKTSQKQDITLNGIVLGDMAVDKERLYVFGDDSKILTAEGEPCTQIYIFDRDSLKLIDQKDLGGFYSMVFSVMYDKKMYFPLYDEKEATSSLCEFDPMSKELTLRKFPARLSDFSNVIAYKDKIYLSHGSVVTGQGKILSICSTKNKVPNIRIFMSAVFLLNSRKGNLTKY